VALAYQPRDETVGRYRLFARLARGGMAELYVARMLGTGRFEKLVAIKRMLPHLVEEPQFVQMFENEAQITARLSHPNICQVYEYGDDGGAPFLVMEFLRGLVWSEIVEVLPADESLRARFLAGVIFQACEGLHYAHTLVDVDGQQTPIVHRDISPGNLMITTDGVVKILDFGVSKVLTEGSATRTGMIKGKLPYMAPEQIRGEGVDGRADVFSLGVVLWEAIAGRRLFERPSDYQIWKAVTEEDIPRLPSGSPLARMLEPVVLRALARDREARQPSARVFADELKYAVTPFGAAMSASEIQAQVAEHNRGRLDRDSRDLAFAISQLRLDEEEAARTSVQLIQTSSVGKLRAAETNVELAGGGAPERLPPLDEDTVDDTDTEDRNDRAPQRPSITPRKVAAAAGKGGIALRESAVTISSRGFPPEPPLGKPATTPRPIAANEHEEVTAKAPYREASTPPPSETIVTLPLVVESTHLGVMPTGPSSEDATRMIRAYAPDERTHALGDDPVPFLDVGTPTPLSPPPRLRSAPKRVLPEPTESELPTTARRPSAAATPINPFAPDTSSTIVDPAPPLLPSTIPFAGAPASGPEPIAHKFGALPPAPSFPPPTTPHVPLTPDERRLVEALRARQRDPNVPEAFGDQQDGTAIVPRKRTGRFWIWIMLIAIAIGTIGAILLRYLR